MPPFPHPISCPGIESKGGAPLYYRFITFYVPSPAIDTLAPAPEIGQTRENRRYLPLPIPLPLFLLPSKRDLNLLRARLPRSVAKGFLPAQHAVAAGAAGGGHAARAPLGLRELDEGVVVVGVFLPAAFLGEAFGRGVGVGC